MRHQIDLLQETVKALLGEAKERMKPNSVSQTDLEALWKLCEARRPDQAVAFRVFHHWKDWILLTALEQRKKKGGSLEWIERGYITVYFGRAPATEIVHGRSAKDTKKAQREMRKILRFHTFPKNMPTNIFPNQPAWLQPGGKPKMSLYKVMVIDNKTSTTIIKEQLAVFMAQLDLADASVMKFLQRRIPDLDTFGTVIMQFADPEHPGSYSEFVKRLKLEAARKAKQRETVPLEDDEYQDPAAMQIRERQGKPMKTSYQQSHHILGLTVWETANRIGIRENAIYAKIETGKVKAVKDERKVLRISHAEVQKLKLEQDNRQFWKALVQIRSKKSSEIAARRWVQRKQKAGCDPKALLEKLMKPY